MEESNPCRGVALVEFRIIVVIGFDHVVKGLGETKQENDVDDTEGEHVTHHHSVDHGHKGSSQLYGTTKENEIEP